MKRVNSLMKELRESNIPEFLRKKGIKGYRRSGESCPIANLIAQETTATSIEVKTKWVNYYRGSLLCSADLPFNAINFIEQFDAGDFPDLVLED